MQGTLTKLAPQKNDTDRLSVFLDGKYAFSAHRDVVADRGLFEGQELTADLVEEVKAASSERAAYARALAYLGHKPRSEREVERRLLRAGVGEALAARTVAGLRERGLLDDEAFARQYVEARFLHRGFGPVRLRNDLAGKGVDPRHVAVALSGLDEDDILSAAREHLRKRTARPRRETNPAKHRKKLMEYLLRRGFSFDIARTVIEERE